MPNNTFREEITPEEVKAIMDKDHKYSEENDWPWDNSNLPSKVDTLDYLLRGDKEKGYARMLLHLRTGKYVTPEDLKFDHNKRVYFYQWLLDEKVIIQSEQNNEE